MKFTPPPCVSSLLPIQPVRMGKYLKMKYVSMRTYLYMYYTIYFPLWCTLACSVHMSRFDDAVCLVRRRQYFLNLSQCRVFIRTTFIKIIANNRENHKFVLPISFLYIFSLACVYIVVAFAFRDCVFAKTLEQQALHAKIINKQNAFMAYKKSVTWYLYTGCSIKKVTLFQTHIVPPICMLETHN